MFDYRLEQPPIDTIDLEDGGYVEFGNSKLKVIHTPGHTRGGVCLYSEEEENHFVITGDSLFAGSIGRTRFTWRRLRSVDGEPFGETCKNR